MNIQQKPTRLLLLSLAAFTRLFCATAIPEAATTRWSDLSDEEHIKIAIWIKERGIQEIDLANAVMNGELEKVKRLVPAEFKGDARLTDQGQSALILAIIAGHREVIQYLAQHTDNLNHTDFDPGLTPLQYAALAKDMDLVTLLLSHTKTEAGAGGHSVSDKIPVDVTALEPFLANSADVPSFACPKCNAVTTTIDERNRLTRCPACKIKSKTSKYMLKQ
ncbi:ankyrin repeat domain-containing protein [Candidatus Dependentiae bacterium]|nr:ankyrin repeat domain-containing protein [Candidatus Dependentiae bacterium]